MTARTHGFDDDELLLQLGWIRRLALELVHEPDAADDVMQDVARVALEKRAAFQGDERGLRAWLAVLARRIAIDRARAESTRAARERSVARAESDESARSVEERSERARVVADAVHALAEPYRTSVLHRYFDGLPIVEVAVLTGVDEATARMRLSRAREMLRERLERRDGRAWLAAIAGAGLDREDLVAVTGSFGATAVVVAGVGSMLTKLVIGAVAACALVGVWLLARPGPQVALPPDSQIAAAGGVEIVDPGPVVSVRATPEPDPGAGRTALGAGAQTPGPAVDEPPTGRYETKIVGRVIDAYEVPAAGAEISVILGVASRAPPTTATADAVGRFEVLVAWEARSTIGEGRFGRTNAELRAVLSVAHDQHFPMGRQLAVRGTETTDAGTIRLEGVARLHGTVRCAPGVDATSVSVQVHRAPSVEPLGRRTSTIPFPFGATAAATVGPDGTFAFDPVPAGRLCVVASAPGALFTATASIDVGPGVDHDIGEIVLEPNTSVVAGVVLMPDGEPCRRANIRYGSAFGTVFFDENVDAEGRFRIEDVEHEELRLIVYKGGDATFCETIFDGVRAGSVDLVLDLADCGFLRVRVVDEAGEPIAKFRADKWIEGDPMPRGGSPLEWPNSTAQVASSGRPFRIHVASPGYESTTVGPYEGEGSGGNVRVVLRRARSIEGRVVADGAGVARVPVFLHAVAASGATWGDGLPARTEPRARAESVTDGEGRFTFEAAEPVVFVVIARSPDWAACESKAVDLRGNSPPASLELALDRGGSVLAMVTSKSGREVGGIVLAASCGDGHLRVATVLSEGTVRFDRLSEGRWWIGRVREGSMTQYRETVRFLGPASECTVARDRVHRVAIEVD